jgi:cold shock CspA family protein
VLGWGAVLILVSLAPSLQWSACLLCHAHSASFQTFVLPGLDQWQLSSSNKQQGRSSSNGGSSKYEQLVETQLVVSSGQASCKYMAFSYFSHAFMDDSNSQAWELGVISSKHKSFGFIRSTLPTDTFFHSSACGQTLFDALQVGDSVCFQLDSSGSKPGKRVAACVTRSSQRPALQQLQPQLCYGYLVKLPDPARTDPCGLMRYIAGPRQVQHLTFTAADLSPHTAMAAAAPAAPAATATPGQPVSFKVLTDTRQQQLAQAAGAQPSPHAVHAYTRAAHVTPLTEAQVVSCSFCGGRWDVGHCCVDCLRKQFVKQLVSLVAT